MTASPLAPPVTFGSSFNDFYDREGLVRLDAAFVEWLKNANVDVHARLLAARAAPDAMAAKDESNLLIELARPLEDFVGVLFGVAHEAAELRARHSRLAPLYDCKRLFVQRYVARALDQANYCIWCHARARTPAQGPEGPRKTGTLPEIVFGVKLAGCARWRRRSREMHRAEARGCLAGRLRDHRRRQPDGGGHRPPHLQRLHEGLHLPEAGRRSTSRRPRPAS
jgi:hypothetical protein